MNDWATDRRVSVILPVYFRESGISAIDFLAQALDSVQRQKFPSDYEIVIVDDGSATPIEGFSLLLGADRLRNVRFVRLTRNSGLVHALNRGLIEARYPWIARLDADDAWLEGKIEKQFALLANDKDITIVGTGMTRSDVAGNEIDIHVRPGDWRGILNFFIEVGCPFPHGSVLARRDIYRLLGGYPHDPAYSHCEDFALWSIWLRFFKPAMVEETLYDYRVSAGSVSGVNFDRQQIASAQIRNTFSALNLIDTLPDALSNLAGLLNCSVTEAGGFAYNIWRFGAVGMLSREMIGLLEIILPDRRLISNNAGHTTRVDAILEVRAV